MDLLPIQPFSNPVDGSIDVPGSKSITNRALILAALSGQRICLKNALFSRDTRIMLKALETLGYDLEVNEELSEITMTGLKEIPTQKASIDVGNAGTAARFLTAFLNNSRGGTYHLDGDEAMRKRPMEGLLKALEQCGCRFEFHQSPYCFPFTMQSAGYADTQAIQVDASSSSQILSALLLANAQNQTGIAVELQGETVSQPFVDMTLNMLRQFGSQVESNGQTHHIQKSPSELALADYWIESDATAASYGLSLPLACGGKMSYPQAGQIKLQGDIGFWEPLSQTGLHIDKSSKDWIISYTGASKAGIDYDFEAISDTFLTLAALSPLLEGPTKISGIAHTRKQETDRVFAMATELRKLGQQVIEEEDSLTIYPDPAELHLRAQAGRHIGRLPIIETYEDHRIAMSFAILGSSNLLGDGEPWLQIADPNCCQKTFPNFFNVLKQLHTQTHS